MTAEGATRGLFDRPGVDLKDPAAVSLGRKGGKAGTGAAKKRSAAFYREQGKARALKRWAKVRAEKTAAEKKER